MAIGYLELLFMRNCRVPSLPKAYEENTRKEKKREREALVPYTEGGGLSKQTLLDPSTVHNFFEKFVGYSTCRPPQVKRENAYCVVKAFAIILVVI